MGVAQFSTGVIDPGFRDLGLLALTAHLLL